MQAACVRYMSVTRLPEGNACWAGSVDEVSIECVYPVYAIRWSAALWPTK